MFQPPGTMPFKRVLALVVLATFGVFATCMGLGSVSNPNAIYHFIHGKDIPQKHNT